MLIFYQRIHFSRSTIIPCNLTKIHNFMFTGEPTLYTIGCDNPAIFLTEQFWKLQPPLPPLTSCFTAIKHNVSIHVDITFIQISCFWQSTVVTEESSDSRTQQNFVRQTTRAKRNISISHSHTSSSNPIQQRMDNNMGMDTSIVGLYSWLLGGQCWGRVWLGIQICGCQNSTSSKEKQTEEKIRKLVDSPKTLSGTQIIERLRATTTQPPFGVKFSSMSESSQTSQADLCRVKRCSCVVFFPHSREKRLDKQAWCSVSHFSSLLKKCWIWIHEIWTLCATRQQSCYDSFNIIRGHKGRVGVGVDFRACLSSPFSVLLGKTTQEHLLT